MTAHHHTLHPKSYVRKFTWGAFSLIVVFLFFSAALFNHTQHTGSPEVSFTDSSAHGLAIVPASCPSNPTDGDAPWGCIGSTPAPPPPPPPAGSLTVQPFIVQRNAHTNVSWSAQNVVVGSCSVTGTNGDSWGGASGSELSKAILAQTSYTLQCTGLDNSPLTISKVVNIVPGFCETGAPNCN